MLGSNKEEAAAEEDDHEKALAEEKQSDEEEDEEGNKEDATEGASVEEEAAEQETAWVDSQVATNRAFRWLRPVEVRTIMAHIRQSKPDSGLIPCSLAGGPLQISVVDERVGAHDPVRGSRI